MPECQGNKSRPLAVFEPLSYGRGDNIPAGLDAKRTPTQTARVGLDPHFASPLMHHEPGCRFALQELADPFFIFQPVPFPIDRLRKR